MAKSREKPAWDSNNAKKELNNSKTYLSGQVAAQFIGLKLSPFHSFYGMLSSVDDGGETYHRSEKHYITKMESAHAEAIYQNKKLKNGDRAHVGAYKNNLERIGDIQVAKVHKTLTTVLGDATIYDQMLEYKLMVCRKIVEAIGQTSNLTVGCYNDYPCLMVHIKRSTIHALPETMTAGINPAAFEAWVNFLISYFCGITNHEAISRGIPIELIRRSSFGFLSPTISPTGESMRINVGLIPEEYINVLIASLKNLDKVLEDIVNPLQKLPKLNEKLFYGNKDHIQYLGKKYQTPALHDALQLLWQKVEKNGKTTVQNIMRTAYARNGVAAMVYSQIKEKPNNYVDAMTAGLNWALNNVAVVKGQLTFTRIKEFTYNLPQQKDIFKSDDDQFWLIINKIIKNISDQQGAGKVLLSAIELIKTSAQNKSLNDIYSQLDYLNESIFVDVVDHVATQEIDDGYGSDSDTEEDVKNNKIYSKKIIVSNGMRAIWASLVALGKHKATDFSVNFEGMYYEVDLGYKLLSDLEKNAVTLKNPVAKSTAYVCVADLNACVTAGKQSVKRELISTTHQALILDSTSATSKQVYKHIEAFSTSRSPVMCLVSSGLKNEQLGVDKNAYGTIRLFSKNKQLLNHLYASIKSSELPVASPTSHFYRRTLKKMGAVPTARAYYNSAVLEKNKV